MDDYYNLEYPDWATIIAITEDGRLVMEKQYRHGLQQVNFELCGGTVEEGEDPLETAKRELLEETVYAGGEWTVYASNAPNPSAMTNICHTFIAKGVKREALSVHFSALPFEKSIQPLPKPKFQGKWEQTTIRDLNRCPSLGP